MWMDSVKRINGWMNDEELTWLHNTGRTASRILEIGVFKGRSAAAMLCGSETSVYFGIDNFEGSADWNAETRAQHYHPDPLHNLGRAYRNILSVLHSCELPRPEGRINLICEDSKHLSRPILHFFINNPPDLIFIDADHSEGGVTHDIRLAKAMVAPGGTIAGHDFDQYHPGVKSAVCREFDDYSICGSIWYSHSTQES